MAEISVTIDQEGNFTVLAKNTLEDLLHDFQYFLKEAKAYDAETPETMFLHKRFLRAALLILFAYAEGVTNRWLSSVLDKHKSGLKFEKLQSEPLGKKVERITVLAAATAAKPHIEAAKRVRNLLVHFKPGRDGEAFDDLSLSLVTETAEVIETWMQEMESSLGLLRHPNSDLVTGAFSEIGTKTKEISSDPGR